MLMARDNYTQLGREIYHHLQRMEWSQRELARRTGISSSNISKMVRGKHRPTPETLEIIGNALGVDHVHLMRLSGIPLPKDKEERDPAIEHIAQRLESLPPQAQGPALHFIGSQIDALEAMYSEAKPAPHDNDTPLNGTGSGVEELEDLESRKPGDPVDLRARKFTKIVREFQFLFPDEYNRIRHVLGDSPVVTPV